MARHPETDQELFEQGRAIRDRARKIIQHSSELVQKTARLEETVHQTEEQLKPLKQVVGKTKKTAAPGHSRRP